MSKFDLMNSINLNCINFAFLIKSIATFPRYLKYHSVRKKNCQLLNKRKTESVSIFVLGPSLSENDISSCADDSMVVNFYTRFAEQKHLLNFRPSFYLLTDDYFASEEGKFFIEKSKALFPNTSFVLNGNYCKKYGTGFLEDEHTFFVFERKGRLPINKKINLSKSVNMNVNVLGFAIQTALGLGYSTINIYGCDFNSYASSKEVHCYTEEHDSRRISMSFELYMYSIAHHQLEDYSKYARLHDVKIYNHCKSSLIDAFEKK